MHISPTSLSLAGYQTIPTSTRAMESVATTSPAARVDLSRSSVHRAVQVLPGNAMSEQALSIKDAARFARDVVIQMKVNQSQAKTTQVTNLSRAATQNLLAAG
jgi:hypothetical protein